MRTNILAIGLCIASTFLFACNEAKTDKAPTATEGEHAMQTEGESPAEVKLPTTANATQKATLASTLEGYDALTNALVQSNAAAATEAAKKLNVNAAGLQQLGQDGQQAMQSIERIAGSSSLDAQREEYHTLSKAMTLLVRTYGAAGNLHEQYCPMAFNNQGATWLSKQADIRNPYFGDAMMECGETKTKFVAN